MSSSVRLSSVVCRLTSVTLVHLTQAIEISAMFLRRLVHLPSLTFRYKFYGNRPRGTPPSGELNTRAEYIDFGPINAISRKRCKIGAKLLLITNRKSHISVRLVPNSVSLDDLERRNKTYYKTLACIWKHHVRNGQ